MRVTVTVLMNDGMDEPLLSVAAALATEGFHDADVEIIALSAEVVE